MNPNTKKMLVETLTVPALAGVTAGVSAIAIGETGSLPFSVMGRDVLITGPLGIGLAVMGSSLLGNAIGNYAMPKIRGNRPYSQLEKLAVLPLLTGASAAAVFAASTSTGGSSFRPFAIGAGSEIVAQYGVDMVKPYIQ